MNKVIVIILCLLLTACVAKEMDFDVFDEKSTAVPCAKGG